MLIKITCSCLQSCRSQHNVGVACTKLKFVNFTQGVLNISAFDTERVQIFGKVEAAQKSMGTQEMEVFLHQTTKFKMAALCLKLFEALDDASSSEISKSREPEIRRNNPAFFLSQIVSTGSAWF